MNKLKTTILSLCLILTCLLIISGVSAVDNTTIIFNETDNTTDNITNDGVVVSNATTFKELQEDINKYDNIELTHDITRGRSQTIEINKTITIDGKGHTIDGAQGGIFYITPTGNLTLKNSKIIKGYSDYGGVICNYGTLTIQGSTFTNNKAFDYGGVICNYGTLTIQGFHIQQ